MTTGDLGGLAMPVIMVTPRGRTDRDAAIERLDHRCIPCLAGPLGVSDHP